MTKPVCSIYNEDACSDEEKAAIAVITAKTDDELLEIAKTVKELTRAEEKKFEQFVEKLQEEFEKEQTAFDEELLKIKATHQSGVVNALLKKRGVENPHAGFDFDDDDDDMDDDDDVKDEL